MAENSDAGAGMLPPRGLPIELFKHILSYLAPDDEIHIEKAILRRQFLSVESLPPPDPSKKVSVRDAVADIGRFRQACKQFADIGAPLLFTQVATRFSIGGLHKLEQLAKWSHLARHVKKFSYMVPYFFEGGFNNLQDLKEELRQVGLRSSDLDGLRQQANDQSNIIARQDDTRALTNAIEAFTSLQSIQLLRVVGSEYEMVLRYLKNHEETRQRIDLDWTSACRHASMTIGAALLASPNRQWNRFSLPAASPASARSLKTSSLNSVALLAERLTCLTLHFDDSEELDSKFQGIFKLFDAIFKGAKKMKAIHIGFLSHRPVSFPLESVFRNVVWEDLVAFGIQGWELDANEIIGLLRRHKAKLRGVRLRSVHLKEGSMWKDVLAFLRTEVHQLLWVSLRRIGYARYFQSTEHFGSEIPDFPDDSEEEDNLQQEVQSSDEDEDPQIDDEESGPEVDDEESGDEHEHEHEHEINFPDSNLNSPVTAAPGSWCKRDGRGYEPSAEDLDDDGWLVDDAKRRRWERWVLWKYP